MQLAIIVLAHQKCKLNIKSLSVRSDAEFDFYCTKYLIFSPDFPRLHSKTSQPYIINTILQFGMAAVRLQQFGQDMAFLFADAKLHVGRGCSHTSDGHASTPLS
jgi:hypothetical protein